MEVPCVAVSNTTSLSGQYIGLEGSAQFSVFGCLFAASRSVPGCRGQTARKLYDIRASVGTEDRNLTLTSCQSYVPLSFTSRMSQPQRSSLPSPQHFLSWLLHMGLLGCCGLCLGPSLRCEMVSPGFLYQPSEHQKPSPTDHCSEVVGHCLLGGDSVTLGGLKVLDAPSDCWGKD